MNRYVENNIKITENSHIEYQIDLSGGKRYDAFIGLTNRMNMQGRYGFIQKNTTNDLFGNAYKFKTKEEAFESIKSNIKSAINRGEYPLPVLKVDGEVVEVFIKL